MSSVSAASRPLQLTLGLLYSTTGSYGRMGRRISEGVMLAVETINASQDRLQLDVIAADPGGVPAAYADACAHLNASRGVQHFQGCYTSAARKWVLPWLDRNDALLWHPARYEGFEADERVIYIGGAPNQHVVPLADYMLRRIGNQLYCIGTDYVWTWETSRVMRELVGAAGGRVIRERLVPFGGLDLAEMVRDILQSRPDAVFNTLVGDSSYEFFRLWAEATRGMENPPVILSCSLCEAELRMIGPGLTTGLICSSPYFSSVMTPANAEFRARCREARGEDDLAFSDAESAWTATHLLARAVLRAGSTAPAQVRAAAMHDRFEAPHGPVHLDPTTNHCFLTPRLGRARADCRFDIIEEAPAPLRPDPFLARLDTQTFNPAHHAAQAGNHNRNVGHLRVIK